MTYTINADILQSNDFGYFYDESEEVTVASGVLVSSTGLFAIASAFADSKLVPAFLGSRFMIQALDDSQSGRGPADTGGPSSA
jgi:hypothetical protein